MKPSLKYLKGSHIQLGCGPHPLWISCQGSRTAIEAAIIQARILTGRYRDDYLTSKFSPYKTGHCSMCGFYPGTVSHYLSGHCPLLSQQLQLSLDYSLTLLSTTPFLLPPVLSALQYDVEDWASFILDPGSNHMVIKIKQSYGHEAVWPLYRLSRAYIRCMHRERMKFMDSIL